MYSLIYEKSKNIIKLFINEKIDINKEILDGESLLFYVLKKEFPENIINLFINEKINSDERVKIIILFLCIH